MGGLQDDFAQVNFPQKVIPKKSNWSKVWVFRQLNSYFINDQSTIIRNLLNKKSFPVITH